MANYHTSSFEPQYAEDQHHLPPSKRKISGFHHVVTRTYGGHTQEIHRQALPGTEKEAWPKHVELTMALQQGKHPANSIPEEADMENVVKESISDMLDQIANNNHGAAQETFSEIIATKVASALSLLKVDCANTMFNGVNEENIHEVRIDKDMAREILDNCGGRDKDFFQLSHNHISSLLDYAKKYKYRKDVNAPGSTARMFHQHATRVAGKK